LSSTLVRTLLQHDWVVYAKPAFGGPTHVLRYLGRYGSGRCSQTRDCTDDYIRLDRAAAQLRGLFGTGMLG
jgi:hypothetical protein